MKLNRKQTNPAEEYINRWDKNGFLMWTCDKLVGWYVSQMVGEPKNTMLPY